METDFQIAAYTLGLARVNAKTRVPFKRGGEFDAFALLIDYFTKVKGPIYSMKAYVSEKQQERESRVMRVDRVESDQKAAMIWGQIAGGESGRVVGIYDIKTGAIKHTQTPDQSGMAPYYFRLYVPDDADRALLLILKRGVHSVRGALEKHMRRYFSNDDITTRFNPVTSAQALLPYLTSGSAKAVYVITHKRPNDPNSFMDGSQIAGQPIPVGTKVQVVIKDPLVVGAALGRLRDRVLKNEDLGKVVEIVGIEDPDAVFMDVKLGKSVKKISIGQTQESAVGFAIDGDKVAIGKDGYPGFDALNKFTAGLCTDLAAQLFK